ncbi:MAG: hypothetical protein ACYDAQ_17105, partial [Mycobacteriales bacterium]
ELLDTSEQAVTDKLEARRLLGLRPPPGTWWGWCRAHRRSLHTPCGERRSRWLSGAGGVGLDGAHVVVSRAGALIRLD